MRARTGLTLLSALAVIATLGCAGAATTSLPCPVAGGAPWAELSSTHFLMRTDLERAEARVILTELERVYMSFEDVAFPGEGDAHDRIDVVVFRREASYAEFGPTPSTAYFTPSLPNDLEPVPTMVMHGRLAPQTRLTLQHELTHHFIHRILGWAPPWLNEGLAQYYSTFRTEGGYAFFGDPLPDHAFSRGDWRLVQNGPFNKVLVPIARVPSVEAIVTAGRTTFYRWKRGSVEPTIADRREQSAFYAGSWALVHMLSNGPDPYPHKFNVFMDAVQRGRRPKLAWRETFSDLGRDRIEADFRAYLASQTKARSTPYEPRALPALGRERAMSSAEVHVLWARLRPWRGKIKIARARADLDEALAEGPVTPELRFWRGMFAIKGGRLAEGERDLVAALAASGEEPRYLLALATLYWREDRLVPPGKRRPERAAAHAARLAKVATTATELDFLGRYYAELALPAEGLPFAARAVKADPTCWRCLDTQAMLLFQKGDVEAALTTQERAVSVMPETQRNLEVLARLRQYERASKERASEPPEEPQGADDADAPEAEPDR